MGLFGFVSYWGSQERCSIGSPMFVQGVSLQSVSVMVLHIAISIPVPCFSICALQEGLNSSLLCWDARRTKYPKGRVMCWCCINSPSLNSLVRWLCELVVTDAVWNWRHVSWSRVMFLKHNPYASVISVSWDSLFLFLVSPHIYPFLFAAFPKCLFMFRICQSFFTVYFLSLSSTYFFVPDDKITP